MRASARPRRTRGAQSLRKYFEAKDGQIAMRLEHVAFNLGNLQKLEDEIAKKKQEIKNNIYVTCGGVQELIELRQNELLKQVRDTAPETAFSRACRPAADVHRRRRPPRHTRAQVDAVYTKHTKKIEEHRRQVRRKGAAALARYPLGGRHERAPWDLTRAATT